MNLQEFLINIGAKFDFKGSNALFIKSDLLKYELQFLNFSDMQYPDIKKITVNKENEAIEVEL